MFFVYNFLDFYRGAADNLYGIGVIAVSTIIKMPYLLSIGFIAVSINSGFVSACSVF